MAPGQPTQTLHYRDALPLDPDDPGGETIDGPETVFSFDWAETPADLVPPKIRVIRIPRGAPELGGFVWDDVVHLSGRESDLEPLRFQAIPPDGAESPTSGPDFDSITWEVTAPGRPPMTATGPELDPEGFWYEDGIYEVVLTDHLGRRRRTEVELISEADQMMIGCARIVTDGTGQPVADGTGPRLLVENADGHPTDVAAVAVGVVGSYQLRWFHDEGLSELHADGYVLSSDEPVSLDASSGSLTIPEGTLAELVIDAGAVSHAVSALRVHVEDGGTRALGHHRINPDPVVVTDEDGTERRVVDPWGPPEPYPRYTPSYIGPGLDYRLTDAYRAVDRDADDDEARRVIADRVRDWAAGLLELDPATSFIVVGRDHDLGTEAARESLGTARAVEGWRWLTDAALGPERVDDDRVWYRGETEQRWHGPASGPDLTNRHGLPEGRTPDHRTQVGFRIERHPLEPVPEQGFDPPSAHPGRVDARCVDLYAVVPDTPGKDQAALWKTENLARRTLVAGPDPVEPSVTPPRETDLDVAVRLLARWDSPTWLDARDSAPTLVELELDWQTDDIELPPELTPDGTGTAAVVPVVPDDGDAARWWRLLIRFTNDPRLGQLALSGALDTVGGDDYLLRLAAADGSDALVASSTALMLGIGPALASAVAPSGDGSGPVEQSLATVAALAGVFALNQVTGVASNGQTTLHRLELGYGRGADDEAETAATIWLYADYTTTFDVALPGGFVSGQGIALRHRRTGIDVGAARPFDASSVGLSFEEPVEVANPGNWSIDDALAKILAIGEVRVGVGSVWCEVDLTPALELGPITIDQATLRLTLGGGGGFELRGLGASVDVPGVVTGSGALSLTEGDGGDTAVSAALDLALEPVGLGIDASFHYQDPMVHLDVGVTFATPIPLLGTGLGLIGLAGRFVANGERNLPDLADPVARELDWLARSDKYDDQPGQFAVGLGATVGTQPDAGFTFNLTGMLAVGLPDPSMVLTVAAAFAAKPDPAAEDNPEPKAGNLLGLVAISDEGLAVGVRGRYGVPSVLDVAVPVAAWFPFPAGSGDAYVRIGADGFEGRTGSPATVTLYPGVLDFTAWAYLMIEAKQLPNLGGKGDEWHFTGFSVGFGAGYDFEWGGSVLYLRAASSLVVGLGTKPLFIKGELETAGELRLGPVGVTVDGEVAVTVVDGAVSLAGEFCGELDLALFTVKECVAITIGDAAEPAVIPDPLVSGVSLTDARGRVVATATDGALGAAHTAWIDCRPTIHFSRRVLNGLDAGSFSPTPTDGWGADWSGSAGTRFLHRLRGVTLRADGGEPLDLAGLPSTWWLPAGRPAIPAEGDPPSSEHDTWDLALLTFDPAPWARSTTDGGAAAEGDPALVVERLCQSVPTPTPHCVYGAQARRLAPARIVLSAPPEGPLPWSSAATLAGEETLGASLEAELGWAGLLGYGYEPGAVVPLPAPWTDTATGVVSQEGWRLARYRHHTAEALAPITVGFDGTYSADVGHPDLTVALSVPVPPAGFEVEDWVTFDELEPDQDFPRRPVDVGLARLRVNNGEVQRADGDNYILFEDPVTAVIGGSLGTIHYGPATRVSVTLFGGPARLIAFDAEGQPVARAEAPPGLGGFERYTLTVDHPTIARVQIVSEGGERGLVELYLQVMVEVDRAAHVEALVSMFEQSATVLAPRCVGRDRDGEQDWPSDLLTVVSSPDEVAAIVRYAPDPADSGGWTGVGLDPTTELDVTVISSCFTTMAALEGAAAAEDAASDLIEAFHRFGGIEAADPVTLLTPDTTYTVVVDYDVATWTDDGTALPSAAGLDWGDPPDSVTVEQKSQELAFRTAAESTMAEADLLRFDAQDVFDPRAAARHVVGFDPGHTDAPHLLDDRLLVHLDIQWIEALLGHYGYDLALDVVRTDPPPGTTSDVEDRKALATVSWDSGTATVESSPADARIAIATLLAPCLGQPLPQGVTAAVDADLVPGASYDLVVNAVPRSLLGGPVVVARSHFTASAYRSGDELLGALGFEPAIDDSPPRVARCAELLVTGPVPETEILADDVALDEALASIGHDPLPVPTGPTTWILWLLDPGGGAGGAPVWTIAGVVLDSREPLEREPRLEDLLLDEPPPDDQVPTITVDAFDRGNRYMAATAPDDHGERVVVDYVEAPARLAIVDAEVGGVVLAPRRSNAAGTRIVLASDAPFVPATGDGTGFAVLELAWTDRHHQRRSRRYIPTVPYLVEQELT